MVNIQSTSITDQYARTSLKDLFLDIVSGYEEVSIPRSVWVRPYQLPLDNTHQHSNSHSQPHLSCHRDMRL